MNKELLGTFRLVSDKFNSYKIPDFVFRHIDPSNEILYLLFNKKNIQNLHAIIRRVISKKYRVNVKRDFDEKTLLGILAQEMLFEWFRIRDEKIAISTPAVIKDYNPRMMKLLEYQFLLEMSEKKRTRNDVISKINNSTIKKAIEQFESNLVVTVEHDRRRRIGMTSLDDMKSTEQIEAWLQTVPTYTPPYDINTDMLYSYDVSTIFRK